MTAENFIALPFAVLMVGFLLFGPGE